MTSKLYMAVFNYTEYPRTQGTKASGDGKFIGSTSTEINAPNDEFAMQIARQVCFSLNRVNVESGAHVHVTYTLTEIE